jgi:hypothetical protein
MTILENNQAPTTYQPKPTINRLTSVEAELTDRIMRETNGQKIFNICRKLSVLLLNCPSEDDREFQDTLCQTLMKSLDCTAKQAWCLIELSLEFVHVKRFGSYRCPNLDLSYLVANASGMSSGAAQVEPASFSCIA